MFSIPNLIKLKKTNHVFDLTINNTLSRLVTFLKDHVVSLSFRCRGDLNGHLLLAEDLQVLWQDFGDLFSSQDAIDQMQCHNKLTNVQKVIITDIGQVPTKIERVKNITVTSLCL